MTARWLTTLSVRSDCSWVSVGPDQSRPQRNAGERQAARLDRAPACSGVANIAPRTLLQESEHRNVGQPLHEGAPFAQPLSGTHRDY